jgi:hypothetical protein
MKMTPRKIFPMKLEIFLRKALPRVRRPDRWAAWRKFEEQTNNLPNGVIISSIIKDGLPDPIAYFMVAAQFTTWYRRWRKDKTKHARSQAARKKKVT